MVKSPTRIPARVPNGHILGPTPDNNAGFRPARAPGG